MHETTNREAGARGWDPAAVDCMMREVEESTETLLPEAEQVELEEEARANWEEGQSIRPRRSPTWLARHSRP